MTSLEYRGRSEPAEQQCQSALNRIRRTKVLVSFAGEALREHFALISQHPLSIHIRGIGGSPFLKQTNKQIDTLLLSMCRRKACPVERAHTVHPTRGRGWGREDISIKLTMPKECRPLMGCLLATGASNARKDARTRYPATCTPAMINALSSTIHSRCSRCGIAPMVCQQVCVGPH